MNRRSLSASFVMATLAVVLFATSALAQQPAPAKAASTAVAPAVAPVPLTRAEIAELIVKARYGDNFTFPPEPFFTDVPAGDPRFKYVQKFRADKLTMGFAGDATAFGATAPVTRFMLASFLVRARFGEKFDYPKRAIFSDVPDSHANFKYVQKAAAAGLVSGCEKDVFCPEQPILPDEGKKAVKAALQRK